MFLVHIVPTETTKRRKQIQASGRSEYRVRGAVAWLCSACHCAEYELQCPDPGTDAQSVFSRNP